MTTLDTTTTWRELLREILEHGSPVNHDDRTFEARSNGTIELVGKQTRWPMSTPAIACPSRKLGYKFMCAEPAWIIGGSNRLDEIMPFAKYLGNFSDDGVTTAGAYGPPFIDQASWAAQALVKDWQSRQAVVSIWRPRPAPSRDTPCTLSHQYVIRDYGGKRVLHCIATMRSSDAWLGIPYDVPTFSAMAAHVALLVREMGGHVDELGTLVLTAGSQHLYERDLDAARECARSTDFLFDQEPLRLDDFARPDDLRLHLWDTARGHFDPRSRWFYDVRQATRKPGEAFPITAD